MSQNSFDDMSTLVQIKGLMPSDNFKQAITWANVDPDLGRHMVLQGHIEFNIWVSVITSSFST